MNQSPFFPQRDHILAKKVNDLPPTESGILTISSNADEAGMTICEILAIGPLVNELEFKAGDFILAQLHWSHQFYLDKMDLILIQAEKVRAKVDPEYMKRQKPKRIFAPAK